MPAGQCTWAFVLVPKRQFRASRRLPFRDFYVRYIPGEVFGNQNFFFGVVEWRRTRWGGIPAPGAVSARPHAAERRATWSGVLYGAECHMERRASLRAGHS